MPHTIIIRAAQKKDVNQLLNIINEAIEHSNALYEEQLKSIEDMQYWFQQHKKNNMPIVVAEINDQIAGYGSYTSFRAKDGFRFTVEHSLYVLPTLQRKGIGKALLQKLVELAKTQKIHSMSGGR